MKLSWELKYLLSSLHTVEENSTRSPITRMLHSIAGIHILFGDVIDIYQLNASPTLLDAVEMPVSYICSIYREKERLILALSIAISLLYLGSLPNCITIRI